VKNRYVDALGATKHHQVCGGLERQVVARGSTNYAAIRSQDVLEYMIPLPDPDAQARGTGLMDKAAVLEQCYNELRERIVFFKKALTIKAFMGNL